MNEIELLIFIRLIAYIQRRFDEADIEIPKKSILFAESEKMRLILKIFIQDNQ